MMMALAAAVVFGGGFGLGVWLAGSGAGSDAKIATAAPERSIAGDPARPMLETVRRAPVQRAETAPILTRDIATPPTSKPRSTRNQGLSPEAMGAPPAPSSETVSAAAPTAPRTTDPMAAPWTRNAVAEVAADDRPMIAIVLDDLGVDRRRSGRAIDLPAPLTLAFLPYATDVAGQANRARGRGHELLVHVPMQPHGADADPGPNALDMDLGTEEVRRRLVWNLDRFTGYVGINNHMGSRFTESGPGGKLVAEEVGARGLMLLDSLTSARSLLGTRGRSAGVPTVERDVFLDNTDSADEVRKRLAQTEQVALREGTAIAIGHPRDATLEVLSPWMADVQARGFALVPLTQVLRARMARIETVEVRE